MMTLVPGANTSLPTLDIEVTVSQRHAQSSAADISAYQLSQSTQKVRGDQDMIFYGQRQTANGSIQLQQSGSSSTFQFHLGNIDAEIGKIAITASLDAPHTFATAGSLIIDIKSAGKLIASAEIYGVNQGQQRTEAALIIGEFYRRNEDWKFRLIAQGFNGGLKPLAEHFGVEISDEPAPAPAPVNLRKITLDKTNNRINLTKQANGFGEIRINLNWNQQANKPATGFFDKLKGAKSAGIDLDLGCFFEMKDGSKGVIQALGNCFGALNDFPYMQLAADDRTGTRADGEWLKINGQHWREIQRIVIFAFIYEGVANWAATDGMISLYVPDQAPIEIQLQEGNNQLRMCGIAELINIQDNIQVSRKMNYVAGHRELDQLFGFGLRWRAGSKD
ncbi:MAG: tellurium resistance protein [Moraxellaceae bacterium]|nr:MAG: tellurium resistance protein [Moraxellaceae bacterium]